MVKDTLAPASDSSSSKASRVAPHGAVVGNPSERSTTRCIPTVSFHSMSSHRREANAVAGRCLRSARQRAVASILTTAVLAGLGPMGANGYAGDTPIAPIRQWRVGDSVTRSDRERRTVETRLLRDGEPVRTLKTESTFISSLAEEVCLSVDPDGQRRTELRSRMWQMARSTSPAEQVVGARFLLARSREGVLVTPLDNEASRSEAQLAWIRGRFSDHEDLDDVAPRVMLSLPTRRPLAPLPLPPESLLRATVTAVPLERGMAQGRAVVTVDDETMSVVEFELYYPVSAPTVEEYRNSRWISGGVMRVRGAYRVQRDSPLPFSYAHWSVVIEGTVRSGDDLIEIREYRSAERSVAPSERSMPQPEVALRAGKAVQVYGRTASPDWRLLGTGVELVPGVAATALHVLAGAREVQIRRPDGTNFHVSLFSEPVSGLDFILLARDAAVAETTDRIPSMMAPVEASMLCVRRHATEADGSTDCDPARVVYGSKGRGWAAAAIDRPAFAGDSGGAATSSDGRIWGIVTTTITGGISLVVRAELAQWPTLRAGQRAWLSWAASRDPSSLEAEATLLAARDQQTTSIELHVILDVAARLRFGAHRAEWSVLQSRLASARGDGTLAVRLMREAEGIDPAVGAVRAVRSREAAWMAATAWSLGDDAVCVDAWRTFMAEGLGDHGHSLRLARALHDSRDPTWVAVVASIVSDRGCPLAVAEHAVELVARFGDRRSVAQVVRAMKSGAGPEWLGAWLERWVQARESQASVVGPQVATEVDPEFSPHLRWELECVLGQATLEGSNVSRLAWMSASDVAVAVYAYNRRGRHVDAMRCAVWGMRYFPESRRLVEYARLLSQPGSALRSDMERMEALFPTPR